MSSDSGLRKPSTMDELVQRFTEEKRKASGSLRPLINIQALKDAKRFKGIYDKMQQRCQVAETRSNSEPPTAEEALPEDPIQRYEVLEKRFNQMNSKNVKLRARNTLLERDKEAIADELERVKADYNAVNLEVNRLRGLNASLKPPKKGEDPELLVAQLKKRNTELQQQNNELLNKLASGDDNGALQHTVKVQILQKDINALKCVIHELENKNENLQREGCKFDDVREENDKLRAGLKERDERYRALKSEFEESKSGAGPLHLENLDLKKKLAAAQHNAVEKDKLAKLVKEQALQLQEGSRNMHDLNEENNQLNEKLKDLVRDNCTLHQQIDDLVAQHQQVLKQQEAEAQQKRNVLEAESEQLKSHIKFLLGDVHKKSQELEQFNNSLKERKLSLQEDVEDLKRELNKALDLVRAKTQDVSNMQLSETKYKQKIGQLEDELGRMSREVVELSERERASANALNDLKNREVTYRQKLARLEKDNGQLKATMDEVNHELADKVAQLEELRELHLDDKKMERVPLGTMDYLRGLISQLHQGNNSLHKAYDALVQENNQLKLKQRDTEAQLQQDNRQMAAKLGEASGELYRLREELLLLKQDVTTTEEENKTLKSQSEKLQIYRKKMQTLEKDNGQLKSELDKVLGDLQIAKHAAEELGRLKKRLAQLECDANALQNNKDAALQQQRELSELIAILKDKLKMYEAENAQLKRDLKFKTTVTMRNLSQADKQTGELQNKNWQLVKQVENMTFLLENAQKRCDNQSAIAYENKELQIKLRDMEINVELLQRDLDSCEDDLNATRKRNDCLVQECNKLKQRLKAAERDYVERGGAPP